MYRTLALMVPNQLPRFWYHWDLFSNKDLCSMLVDTSLPVLKQVLNSCNSFSAVVNPHTLYAVSESSLNKTFAVSESSLKKTVANPVLARISLKIIGGRPIRDERSDWSCYRNFLNRTEGDRVRHYVDIGSNFLPVSVIRHRWRYSRPSQWNSVNKSDSLNRTAGTSVRPGQKGQNSQNGTVRT
jgi:hypothetical protein